MRGANMKVGSLGYATCQGLGFLLKDFYECGVITDVMTVEHWKYVNHDWYNGPRTSLRNFDSNALRRFADGMDVMFFFETPFDPTIIGYCRDRGIKTILMPMYECTPSEESIGSPDLIINPSLLDQQHYPKGTHIPVPIPTWVKWRQRKTAEVFVHNTGHLGMLGRNGTTELLKAMKYVKSPIKLIVRCQEPIGDWAGSFFRKTREDNRVELITGTVPKEELYERGDVFVFPETFNGLSLPLQEAKAAGMLIMATNRFPTNTWTSDESLIDSHEEKYVRILQRKVLTNVVDPKEIAYTIDWWYGKNIEEQSLEGRMYREIHSWGNLKGAYLREIFNCVMRIGA